jgi:hypothetical protein
VKKCLSSKLLTSSVGLALLSTRCNCACDLWLVRNRLRRTAVATAEAKARVKLEAKQEAKQSAPRRNDAESVSVQSMIDLARLLKDQGENEMAREMTLQVRERVNQALGADRAAVKRKQPGSDDGSES